MTRGAAAAREGEGLIHPDETPRTLTERICATTLRPDGGRWTPLWWWLCLGIALALLAGGAVSVAWLFYAGLGIWGIDWPVAWGFDILNYVWWIAIASGGTFISALFFMLRAPWRTSLNRLAESLTLCAALCAAIFPILHLGRPQFFYWLFPYPNTMGLWAQFRSPLVWDFFAILAYVSCSVMFWYFGLLPDLATLRDRAQRPWQQLFYGVLALGFRGSGLQWRHYQPVYGVMAALMAPLVVSVHSIVGMDFAGGATTGWHSTQFPPFFVFGAALSGFAVVLLAVIPLRRGMGLHPYITNWHIDVLGRLLLTASLCVAYAYVMDVFSTFYGPDQADRIMFAFRLHGLYAPVYWGTIMLNIVFPQVLWWRSVRLNQPVVWLVCLGVIIGMWLERFQIIVTSLARTQLPSAWGQYTPTLWEWSLLGGTIGLFLTTFLLLVRFIPMLAMAEMRAMLGDRP
ncbi:NrfD/PsrC family molybdoenzyme membrane anchor subunit [Komagataeibacter sp. FNDCR2]|uniref:NrfD/PsrC family molybdoenzyme membrane anchor subunit n=1 Tax=Komagataeibacter sp. FNDCR2 TaxID=2878682 RepID=UPI001E3243A4|nr:NrfD/PsrC family molybdoenzyme membrane anchor subunit [Komagataeibacter sp. FNDCR2]MCE2576574.1 polysulfide reductase NrfD [Komagataeibacter sp. FNDCR2]